MIEIHTDGSAQGNPGPGGWAAVIIEDDSRRDLHGAEKHTTNNRMEILAVIKGLEAVPDSAPVAVFSDSQYVVNTMTRNWKRNANTDLWVRLDAEADKRKVSWNWVRGHDGNTLNEEADAWPRLRPG
ncbi:MAG: ribonuclease H [SAR202 cluster bacterium]|nr:ribonuclease H [SAR202 cluster bacterium]